MRRISIVLACLAIVAGACGKSNNTASPGASTESGGSTPASAAPGACAATASGAKGSKPAITVPSCPPPKTLVKADLIVGTGATATAGHHVTVQYVGVAWSNKTEFDSSWKRNSPFDFDLGAGNVIKGWDEGLVGMKVGGRRLLTIPPDLAYGERGAGQDIGPNETLVFAVDLVAVK